MAERGKRVSSSASANSNQRKSKRSKKQQAERGAPTPGQRPRTPTARTALPTTSAAQEDEGVQFEDFEETGIVLGTGSYGSVRLCTRGDESYALKFIERSKQMDDSGSPFSEHEIRNEVSILQHAKHCEGVVDMLAAFRSDQGDIAIFLEFAPLDLAKLIQAFDEVFRANSAIQFYAAAILRG